MFHLILIRNSDKKMYRIGKFNSLDKKQLGATIVSSDKLGFKFQAPEERVCKPIMGVTAYNLVNTDVPVTSLFQFANISL